MRAVFGAGVHEGRREPSRLRHPSSASGRSAGDSAPRCPWTTRHTLLAALAAALMSVSVRCGPAAAQTINGTLMEVDTDRPIDLGLVIMFTEEGDSVAMTVTDERGRFRLSAPRPGSFLLLASALGYEETPAGVFELGPGSVMEVEYRVRPNALPIDEIVVAIDRPVVQHKLVQNGFVRRLQRGLGAFITPHDIEESPAMSTESLLANIPGVRVGDVRVKRPAGDSLMMVVPRSDIGETVQIQAPGGGWCTPTVYVDGIRTFYTAAGGTSAIGLTLSMLAPLATVEAIEVYRRPAEIPVEYSLSAQSSERPCGVLVLWTKSGPMLGQEVTVTDDGTLVSVVPSAAEEQEPLAEGEMGPAPAAGERIRVLLDGETARGLGVTSPWEGTLLTVRSGELVANDPRIGRVLALPADGIEALQVRRSRAAVHALKRGAVVGVAFGVGMWQFLGILCRSACDGFLGSAWLPASVTGTVVGLLVAGQGPGAQWVPAPLPELPPPLPGREPWGRRSPRDR